MTDHVATVCEDAGTDHGLCSLCDGGLFWCSVCGGAEGSLARECPGYRLAPETLDAIYNQECDFKDGAWYTPQKMGEVK